MSLIMMTMTYEMPKLPYANNALEPVISQQTIDFHYGKHLQTYVNNLNSLVPGTEYEGKTVLCWQQFYGIAIAFFCRLFHLKKKYRLVIMTFIYKQKRGLPGKIFYHFVKYAITSQ